MWALQNQTPFAAERTWVRDEKGAELWIVAVKATFDIKGETVELAKEQAPVCRVPVYSGEPGASSLVSEADLLHAKPTTDVLLLGHAYAPGGKPAPEVTVTMRAGPVSKSLSVVGDRMWKQSPLGVTTTDPEPFDKMPICYERAFGGADPKNEELSKPVWEPRNPIGTGMAADKRRLAGQRMPNVLPAGGLLVDRDEPVGLGPIARDWMPRRGLAGTYDEQWEQEQYPLLPPDFDRQFYQSAPADQQSPEYLRGGERVELENLTPDGRLQFDLPRVVLGFRTFFAGGDIVHHRADLHTVLLEPDVSRVTMTWHTSLPCHTTGHKLLKTVVVRKRRVAKFHRAKRRARRGALK